ncbi:zinc metalloproteinase-disintegrin-like brevilysin H2a [Solea senegalensis]|uniref:Zinc metalloproteinase-disintegrin-like brevilysin H2a n=2 Tax=Solea senegalensis TaxID=28829 RepID=A0AAV6P9D9_SOLSE|nr:zinc metalloproteinase-disintegrin-like batroxstatin-1 [Solea senegalensis]KAG7453988.1 zinc metalloproteinase-disintegrin-like brevilysin H2a [Solea senegalensis]
MRKCCCDSCRRGGRKAWPTPKNRNQCMQVGSIKPDRSTDLSVTVTVCTWTMSRTLLLWILILNASPEPSESHGSHGFEEVKDYQVVRPIRLHSVRKRQAEYIRPVTLKYGMTLGGKNIEMQLQKNDELLSKDYTETYYKEDGTRVTTSPEDIDHCYYHGNIVDDNNSSVSISTCDGLRGYFRTSAQKYLIEPLSGDDEGDHAVTTFSEKEKEKFTPAVCGVTNTSWSDDFEPPTSLSRSRSGGIPIVQQQKYIELFLVADNRAYVKMKRDQTKLRKRIFEIVNFVNMAYKPLRTFIALVGLEIWSNRDLITVTPPAGANLDAFMKWRNSELAKRKKHDNAHLISGIDFEGATVGLAFIGTMCSGHSVGVVQDHNDRAIAVGATLAHEMGHNLGMSHDDSSACSCVGDTCIMAAALSWDVPRTFSSCSSNTYEKYLMNRSPSCLMDIPDYRSLSAPSVCGNGFTEAGEECDCGTVKECTNPCCNATTCRLSEGSQCADGECCESCEILPHSRECRRKQDECDLPEYCDGTNNVCPEDMFAVNGLPCDGSQGYCYNGQCPQRPNQCVKMYGAGAVEAKAYCYNYNTRGTYYSFCKRPSKDQYIPCQQQDKYCGKLFCQQGKGSPNYGRMVRVGDCKAAFFDDHTKDFGQVDTGTECGTGKVCSQNECVDLAVAYRNVNCSAKCSGHAVCNHRSECQCEPGWMPPNCDSRDGSLVSPSTGIIIAVVVVVLMVLGIIGGVVGLLWKKRKLPMLPMTHTRRKPAAMSSSAQRPHKPSPIIQVSHQAGRPKGAPPPPPPAGNRPKPPGQNYTAARQALRPVPHPKV